MGCAAPPSGAEEKMRGGDTFYALDIRVSRRRDINPNTGARYVSPKEGDYARAEVLGVRVVLMLVETFGRLGPALVEGL